MGTTCSLNEIEKLSHCSGSGSGRGRGSGSGSSSNSKYKRNPFFFSVYALSFCNDDSTYQVIHSELTQQGEKGRRQTFCDRRDNNFVCKN